MNPSARLFRSRMAHIHHGSLLASTEPGPLVDSPTDSPLSEQALALVLRKPWSDPEDDHASTSEQTDDDEEFEEITYDELRLSICPADPAHFAPVFGECLVGAVTHNCNSHSADYQRAYHPSLLARSRTSLTRLRKLSQASLKKSRAALTRSRLRQSTGPDTATEHPLAVAVRRPSCDSSSGTSSAPETPPHHHSALLLDINPYHKETSPDEQPPEVRPIVEEPDSLALVRVAPPRRSLTNSIKRLRTLSKSSLFGARRHAPQVSQVPPTERSGTPPPSTSPVPADSLQLPELVFDQLDFAQIVEEGALAPAEAVAAVHPADPSPSPAPAELPLSLPRIEVIDSSPHLVATSLQLQVPRFELVDPRSLTASAPPSAIEGASLFGGISPSPSWISRTLLNIEVPPSANNSPAPLPIPPPPSPPLYIVPRSLRPDTYYLRGPEVSKYGSRSVRFGHSSLPQQIEFEFTTAPQTPRSTATSPTLYNPSTRLSLIAPSTPVDINHLSVFYRGSIVDNRLSVVAYKQERDRSEIITVR